MNRFPTLSLGLAALLATGAVAAGGKHALPYTLPGKMDQLRFVVQAKAPGGATLDLYTDTAGGTNFATSGADKLKLPYTKPKQPRREPAGKTAWPAFDDATWIPPPAADDEGKVDVPILVPPHGMLGDGVLGLRWFAGHTVEWDYPAGTLRLLPRGALPKVAATHVVAMGFRKDGKNPQATGFARIPARVDGADLQFVFDTGATFRMTKDAAATLGNADVLQRAGSFIGMTRIKDWHARHPDWAWIEHGDAGAPMIKVPDIEIAGWHTGPVWFSGRSDRAFNENIVKLIDRPVDGALGGNAFATFRITADYPSEKMVFEQPAKPGR